MLSCNACGRTARPGERCGEPSRPSRAAQAPCHREKADAGSASSFNFESSRSPRRRRLPPPHIGFEFQFRIKSNAPSVPPREGCLSFPSEMQNGVNASSRRFCCPKMPKSKTSFRTAPQFRKPVGFRLLDGLLPRNRVSISGRLPTFRFHGFGRIKQGINRESYFLQLSVSSLSRLIVIFSVSRFRGGNCPRVGSAHTSVTP